MNSLNLEYQGSTYDYNPIMCTEANNNIYFALRDKNRRASLYYLPKKDFLLSLTEPTEPLLLFDYRNHNDCTGIMPSSYSDQNLWLIIWQINEGMVYAPKIGRVAHNSNQPIRQIEEIEIQTSGKAGLFYSSPHAEKSDKDLFWVVKGITQNPEHNIPDAKYDLVMGRNILANSNTSSKIMLEEMRTISSPDMSFGRICPLNHSSFKNTYLMCGRPLHKRNSFNNAPYKIYMYSAQSNQNDIINLDDLSPVSLDYGEKNSENMEAYPCMFTYREESYIIINTDNKALVFKFTS